VRTLACLLAVALAGCQGSDGAYDTIASACRLPDDPRNAAIIDLAAGLKGGDAVELKEDIRERRRLFCLAFGG